MPLNPNRLSKFWQDLKRRNVVRVITVYAAAAFAILELVDILAEPFGLPGWTIKFVVALLSVGLIISAIVSWIYDIHPEEGIVKTEPAHLVKKEDIPVISNKWKVATYISFVVIVGLVVLNIISRINLSREKALLDKSIAVLPFRNESSDEENTYFINGTMESILNNLCKIRDLNVRDRTSVEQYRNVSKPLPDIANEMNVSYVLEGSGQKLGNRIMLSIQLIEGKKGHHLWSRQYDRKIQKVEDLIDIQSEVAQLVAAEIEAIITPEEKQLIENIPTLDLTAYYFYQRGREEHLKYKLGDDNGEALQRAEYYYHKALEDDSAFALAYTGLAEAYRDGHFWKTFTSENFMDTMLILANTALSFDDQLAEAYFIRGQYYRSNNENEQALNEYDKAIKLNPNLYEAYWSRGVLYRQDGDFINAIDNYQTAAALHKGPLLTQIYQALGGAYTQAGFEEKATDYLRKALELDNDSLIYYENLANLEYTNGNFKEAIGLWEKSYAIDSMSPSVLLPLGKCHMWLGQYEKSLAYFKEFSKRIETLSQPYGTRAFQIGFAYWVNGFEEEAAHYFDIGFDHINKMIELNRHFSFHNLAAMYAFQGEKVKAYEYLGQLDRDQGNASYIIAEINNDPMFDNIRDEPEFQQIVRDLEAKYKAEHERVRQWLEENNML
jgi:TolB-like protein/tetratricopeptide (TPR) repeat protein